MIYTINGIQYEKKTNTNLQVFTGERWVFDMFDGYRKDNSELKPIDRSIIIDDSGNKVFTETDGLLIIGVSIADDPTWNLDFAILDPDGNPTTPRQEMTKINYVYLDEVNP